MTTEYRQGIPSTAHVEAATRLGLSWQQADAEWREWCFEVRGRDIWCDFAPWDARGLACLTEDNRVMSPARAMSASWRPIRPDGTLVDWEVLDQEVARVGQPQTMACNLTAPAAPTTQPQGFRADLWARICRHFSLTFSTPDVQTRTRLHSQVSNLTEIASVDDVGVHSSNWQWGWGTADREAPTQQQRTDILARWTVYQELKPLYDLVDGAQGEAAMPRDVYNECRARAGWTGEADDRWLLRYNSRLEAVGIGEVWHGDGRTSFERANMCNFAAVLDAVAERRVAERMRGQAQAPTVTSAQPEPRRFADVRPDRHGWRWWRVINAERSDVQGLGFHLLYGRWSWLSERIGSWASFAEAWLDRTVIPTDEQGNPVSWESIGPAQAQDQVRTRLAQEGIIAEQASVQRAMDSASPRATPADAEISRAIVGSPPISAELPRFTADELDDVDHSHTTKLDQATLRRGKLPTVEQIAKYREVRAKRTGGSVADALKESRIDCEVAQYVLERWASGLGNERVRAFVIAATGTGLLAPQIQAQTVDQRLSAELSRSTLDTTEPPDTAAQQARQQAEERRQRLAQVQAQIAAERATTQPQEATEPSRFDLIEPDPQADPIASIRAWEARQAAAKRAQAAVATMPAKPAAVPRKPAIEVVDAESDGLSRFEVLCALAGRAMHGGC